MSKDKLLTEFDELTTSLLSSGLTVNAELLTKIQNVRDTIIRRDLADDMPRWVSAVHKAGRQVQNYMCLWIGFYLLMHDKAITLEAAVFMGGSTMLYTYVKGKGGNAQS